MVHDTVAQKNFDPVLPPLPDNIDEDFFDEESVKIVQPGEKQGTLGMWSSPLFPMLSLFPTHPLRNPGRDHPLQSLGK